MATRPSPRIASGAGGSPPGRPPGAREATLTEPDNAAGAAVDDAFLARVLLAFQDKSAPERARILKSVRAAVDGLADPYLDSLRPFAKVAPQDAKSRIGKLPWKDPGAAEDAGDGPLYAELPFPVRNHYRFGFRSIIPVVQEGTKARDKPRFPAAAPDDEQLRAMLLGFPPDLDLILAGLLRALDNDRAADRYACFLECWRNCRRRSKAAELRRCSAPAA